MWAIPSALMACSARDIRKVIAVSNDKSGMLSDLLGSLSLQLSRLRAAASECCLCTGVFSPNTTGTTWNQVLVLPK